jgi:hypothetical protein
MFGLIAFCSFWSIKELFQQKKRVERGWFPRKKAAREIKLLTQEKFTEK